jgi:phage tail-like protein
MPDDQPSSYLQYLPTPYQGDAFLGRFLRIFESILGPIEQTIDGVSNYFDPHLTPIETLPWLASWIGVELDENWPVAQRRELLVEAAELLRRQGTRHALREHLRLYVGQPPLIVENFSGLRLGQDGVLGVNSRLGALEPHTIGVTVVTDHDVDEQVLRGIVEAQKPAHVGYTLEVYRADANPPDPDEEAQSEPSGPIEPAPLERSMSLQESV